MLKAESLWYRERIEKDIPNGALVLNIGSSTEWFISVKQPYIKSNIINVLTRKGCIIKNVDIRENAELVGDIADPAFASRLRAMNADMIICSNVLEHIADRRSFCNALTSLVGNKTKLYVSVPKVMPYHEDPIDTMYRPTPSELLNDFPNLSWRSWGTIEGDLYFFHLGRTFPIQLWRCIKTCVKYFVPGKHKEALEILKWLPCRLSVSYVILSK